LLRQGKAWIPAFAGMTVQGAPVGQSRHYLLPNVRFYLLGYDAMPQFRLQLRNNLASSDPRRSPAW
jgi:hypothetical protein